MATRDQRWWLWRYLQWLGKLHSEFRVSNIHLPSKIAITPSKWYVSELDILEVHYLNKSWSTRVKAMKLYYFIRCKHIQDVFPRVFFQPKFSLLDQILILFTMTVTVQNLLYFLLFFSIDNNRVWRWLWTSSRYGILSSGSKLDNMECQI